MTEITDRAKFNSFAKHILQSWEWGEFKKQTPGVRKVLRLGKFQIFFHQIPGVPFCIAYIPYSEMPNSEALGEIIKIAKKEKALFLKIEPFSILNFKYQIPNTLPGKPLQYQHTIYIDLTLTEDKLLAQMHEKTRYNIRLAQKKGVIVREENSPEALENFIKLLEATEKRQGFLAHYPQYYRQLWKTLRPEKIAYLLSAYVPTEQGQQLAASYLLLRFKDFLYYTYGSSDPEFRQSMAPQLLHFEAMKLGKKLGCKTYDLWGSYKHSPSEADPWWGIYRLKSGFGGKKLLSQRQLTFPFLLYTLFILWLILSAGNFSNLRIYSRRNFLKSGK